MTLYPASDQRPIYSPHGYLLRNSAYRVYTDAGATTPATIYADNNGSQGSAVANSRLYTNQAGILPRFHADGVSTLYGKPDAFSGPIVALTPDPAGLVLSPSETGAAIARKQHATGWAVVTDPAFGYESGAEIGPALQAAIDSLPTGGTAPGGTVVIPPGQWTINDAPVVLKSGVRIVGAGRFATRLTSTRSTPMFTWSANMNSVEIRSVYLRATAGHVFRSADNGAGADFGWHTSTIEDCYIYQSSTAHSIVHHDSNSDYDRVVFRNSYLLRANDATVPAFYIRNSIGGANENIWQDCWIDTGSATAGTTDGQADTHFFHIENTGVANYAYDNVFRNLIGQRVQAGLINLLSALNTTIENCVAWDAETTYARDWIRVGKSATGPASKHVRIIGGGRRGGTLEAGVYDINFVSGEVTDGYVENFCHSSTDTRINFDPANRITIINTNAGAYTGQPTNARTRFGDTPHFPSGLYMDNSGTIAFGSDVNLFRHGADTLRTQDTFYADGIVRGSSQVGGVVDIGAVGPGQQAGVRLGASTLWLRGSGAPEGAVAAPVGSLYTRIDGGTGTTLYVKESGTGNTGWVAK